MVMFRSRQRNAVAISMTDAERCELKIAGLLHDRGKIVTPVYVVGKATKLDMLTASVAESVAERM